MLFFAMSKAQTEMPLYSNPIPNSKPCNKKEKEEWITSVPEHGSGYSNVYGPFIKEKYLQKRKELNVSDTLNLKWKE